MVTPPNARGKREHSEGRQENFVSQRLQIYVVRFFNFSKNGLHWLQKLHIFQFLWQTHDNAYCDFSIGKISSSLNANDIERYVAGILLSKMPVLAWMQADIH